MPERLYLSPPHLGRRERQFVEEVFDSNWIAPIGPMVDRFEAELSLLIGTQEVVALSSGTAALHLALRLSGVEQGDEVWGSTMTFIGGVAPILYESGIPVFLDVDPNTLLLDLDLLEQTLQDRNASSRPLPKVVISTDLYGSAVSIARMNSLRERFGFRWISDTAEALGSHIEGLHAGCGADFTILSFNGNKIITTSGGGALCCKDRADALRARFLATQAREPTPYYEHETYGYNYRLSGICAAIGLGQLEVLGERVAARRAIHAAYLERLAGQETIFFHDEPMNGRSNRWLTTIELTSSNSDCSPESVRLALELHNIESRPLWKPMHMQPVFEAAPSIGGAKAANAFARGLCLPSGSQMTAESIDRVTNLLLQEIL